MSLGTTEGSILTTLITWVFRTLTGTPVLLAVTISFLLIISVPVGTPDMVTRLRSTNQSPSFSNVIYTPTSLNSNVLLELLCESSATFTLGETPPMLVVAFPLFYVHQLRIRHAL